MIALTIIEIEKHEIKRKFLCVTQTNPLSLTHTSPPFHTNSDYLQTWEKKEHDKYNIKGLD